MKLQRYQLFINGEACDPESGAWFESADPSNRLPWSQVARGNAVDVDLAVASAQQALASDEWGGMTPSARGALIGRLGDAITHHVDRLIDIETRDNGKLRAEASMQLNYIPEWFHYFGGLADKLQGSVIPMDKKGYFAYTTQEPLGVTAIITPWNSPLMLLAWKLAPALAAGCTTVVKPSEFTSASTIELATILTEAGLPPGVLNVVTGFGHEVGAPLVEHPGVRKVSFTGSDATGRLINEVAARDFKHVSLELGGKSPNIVFADADMEAAVNGVAAGIFAAAGQTCIAGSRLLVEDSVHDEMVTRLTALASSAVLGDPREEKTQIGPIATEAQYTKILEYIQVAKDEGAHMAFGETAPKDPPDGEGLFVGPTIFTRVNNSMRIAQEEVFGPVLAVIPFKGEEEAIRLANESRYGLGAGVWTTDMGRAFRVSQGIRAGTVWVNTYRAVSYLAPFGGFGHSGVGRENGINAVSEFTDTKTVWINTGSSTGNPFIMR